MAAPSGRSNASPAFRFVVQVNGSPYGVFTECTLPSIEWETQPIKEGGLNTRVHHLLGRRKETKITLKNGVGSSDFVNWYLSTMGGDFGNLRRKITIELLNQKKNPVMTWHIEGALPVKWSGPQLKTDDTSIAIQSLELMCGEISVTPGDGIG